MILYTYKRDLWLVYGVQFPLRHSVALLNHPFDDRARAFHFV